MLLSKVKVDNLFSQEAMLIGKIDGVPYYRAIELFGEDAANYGQRGERTSNIFGLGDSNKQLKYLNKEGFYRAASWANVEKALEIEKGVSDGVQNGKG